MMGHLSEWIHAARKANGLPNQDWRTASSGAVLEITEVIASYSDPILLRPDHPWRQVPCLFCAQPANDRLVRAVVIVGAAITTTPYWRIGTTGYLVCQSHGKPPAFELWLEAHKRERPGCPCHSRSAALAATYPYHQGSQGWLI